MEEEEEGGGRGIGLLGMYVPVPLSALTVGSKSAAVPPSTAFVLPMLSSATCLQGTALEETEGGFDGREEEEEEEGEVFFNLETGGLRKIVPWSVLDLAAFLTPCPIR